jgi:hypothetical protein
MPTRIEQKIMAIEKVVDAIHYPDPMIIYTPGTGEPEASIQRFEAKYPDFDGALVVIPNNGRDVEG